MESSPDNLLARLLPNANMVRRRAKKRSRRRKTFSILAGLEAYTYASILSKGIFGTSPVGVITGKDDFAFTETPSQYAANLGVGNMYSEASGFNQISLMEIINKPDMALGFASVNLRRNMIPMAIQSFGTAFAFRIGRRLLRAPISSVTRNIIKPVLGAGVRL